MFASRNVASAVAPCRQNAEWPGGGSDRRERNAARARQGTGLVVAAVEDIEPDTLTQITNLANLPGAAHVAVMPDAHKGYGMPIGCALATTGTVVPYAVGVDIGCGMIAVRTSLEAVDCADGSIEAALHGI